VRTASLALALAVAAAGCTSKPPPSTYNAGVVPGVSVARAESLLGKPSSTLPFSLPGIDVQVLAYPFGQVVVRAGKVIAVTIATDPAYVGPHGVGLRMSEDKLAATLKAAGGHRTGHRDSYELIVGDTVTRTKDVYDETDHVMYELAASNPNDPETSYSVVGMNLANREGFSFFEAVTKAKVSGLYVGQHVDNFTSEPWST
jgi:hypothetical protein